MSARTESGPPVAKALTVILPWSPLLVIPISRRKIHETRSWSTRYRGPLYIHAGKTWDKSLAKLCLTSPFRSTLEVVFGSAVWNIITTVHQMRGRVVGKVNLVDCVRVEDIRETLGPTELAFGDFSDGRFAWVTEDPVLFIHRPLVRGRQGLWNLDPITAGGCR